MKKFMLCFLVAAFLVFALCPVYAGTSSKIEKQEKVLGGSMYHGVITVSGALSGTYSYVYSSGLLIDACTLALLSQTLGSPYSTALANLTNIGTEIAFTDSFFWGNWNGDITWQNPTAYQGDNLAWVAMNVVPGRTAGWTGEDEWSEDETSANGSDNLQNGSFTMDQEFTSVPGSNRISTSSYVGAIEVFEATGSKYVSPIVLDMTGSGKLEASGGKNLPHPTLDSSNLVKMDFFNNGFEIAMEWVGPNDGLLVAPKADGSIDPTCLFGSNGGFENGFEKLSLWDVNKDSKVSGNELAGLAVWQDKNQNGIAEKNEVTGLTEAGISSLSLSFNLKEFTGTFVRDGKTCKMWDWWPTAVELKKVSSK